MRAYPNCESASVAIRGLSSLQRLSDPEVVAEMMDASIQAMRDLGCHRVVRRVERDLGATVSIAGGFEVRFMRGKQGEHVRHAATANLEMLVMKSRGGAGMEVETG